MHENDQQEKEYLKELAPTLFGQKHEILQDAPEGYFEALPDRVLQRIAAEKQPKGRLIKFVNFRNLAIAAGFALVLAALSFLQHHSSEGSETHVQVTYAEIDFSDDATLDVLAEMIDGEIIYASALSDGQKSWEISENFEDQDIVDFISDEGLSEEVLYDTNF
jgi:hypothetical protein